MSAKESITVVIAAPKFAAYDAVSGDVEGMYRCLSGKYNCKVFAEYMLSGSVEYITGKDLKKALGNPDNILIYHHSVYWVEGEKALKNAKCRVIFRYHNITPPSFYTRYNEINEYACRCGIEQTAVLAQMFPNAQWLCNSYFTARELNDLLTVGVNGFRGSSSAARNSANSSAARNSANSSATAGNSANSSATAGNSANSSAPHGTNSSRIHVCPPFNKTEEWSKTGPDGDISNALKQSPGINLLFVGRLVPNKGHLFLLDILRCYTQNYDANIKLRMIGSIDKKLEGYHQEIKHKAKVYGLADNIEIIGETDDKALTAYYSGSDFFISASEHEGFMIPVIEAQCLKLPVIARRSSAVPETLGDNQILLGDDPAGYAAAIHLLYNNSGYRDFLRAVGYENYSKRFTGEKIAYTFTGFLKINERRYL